MEDFRFERIRKLGLVHLEIKLHEFVNVVKSIENVVKSGREGGNVLVHSTDDPRIYQWKNALENAALRHHTLDYNDPIADLLRRRRICTINGLEKEVWNQSLIVQAIASRRQPPTVDTEQFMIVITYDRQKPDRISFYGQHVEEEMKEKIFAVFHHRDWLHGMKDYMNGKEEE